MGFRRDGREVTAALRRADAIGWTGFFDRGDVPARGAGVVDLGARRRGAGRFSAMAPAINAPICCRYCATSVSRWAMRRSWAWLVACSRESAFDSDRRWSRASASARSRSRAWVSISRSRSSKARQ